MKYCVEYYKNFRYNDTVDEVIFSFTSFGGELPREIQKGNWKETQRIIIEDVYDEEALKLVKICEDIHSNLAIKIYTNQYVEDPDLVKSMREMNIPFFFADYANTADEIFSMIQRGASDVYITESAAFNIIELGEYCKKKGVKVRVIPNIAQSKVNFGTDIPDLYKFFIRPEDTYAYEKYVDVFELIASKDRLSVVFEIYKNKQWLGDLNQLIGGLSISVTNTGLVPYFGEARLGCKQRCMQEKCARCKQMQELAEKFVNHNLEIKGKKDNEWQYENIELRSKLNEEVMPNEPASNQRIIAEVSKM